MEMSIALQVALFLASIAVVALVVCIVPIAIQVGRSLRHLALTTERLEVTAQTLLRDSSELVRSVNELSERTNRYMEEGERLAHVAQVWTDRMEALTKEIGSALEAPVMTVIRNSKILQVGAAAFLHTLLHPHRPIRTEH